MKTITINVPDNFEGIPVQLGGYVSSRSGAEIPTVQVGGSCSIFNGEARTTRDGKPYFTGNGSVQLPIGAFNLACELLEAGVFVEREVATLEPSDTAKKYLSRINFRKPAEKASSDATESAGDA